MEVTQEQRRARRAPRSAWLIAAGLVLAIAVAVLVGALGGSSAIVSETSVPGTEVSGGRDYPLRGRGVALSETSGATVDGPAASCHRQC